MVFDDWGTNRFASLTALPQPPQGYNQPGSSLVKYPAKNTDRCALFTGFVQDSQGLDLEIRSGQCGGSEF